MYFRRQASIPCLTVPVSEEVTQNFRQLKNRALMGNFQTFIDCLVDWITAFGEVAVRDASFVVGLLGC